ncbi:MAG: hypothetical protein J0H19_25540 [Rhodospirillales bacterium]|nr:hypothetical protein [Rhodospirillales bacterium]
MKHAIPAAIAVVCSLAAAACSPDYSTSVTKFAEGVSDLRTASKIISAAAVKAKARADAADIITSNDRPQTVGCDGGDDWSGCFVVSKATLKKAEEKSASVKIANPKSDSRMYALVDEVEKEARKQPPPPEDLKPPQVCIAELEQRERDAPQRGEAVGGGTNAKPITTEAGLMAALDKYAAGLAAVTKASDVADYNKAASSLSSTIGTIATTAGSLAGPVGLAAGTLAKPIVDAALRLNLARYEANRYRALREAVISACIPVAVVALAEGNILITRRSDALFADKNVLSLLVHDATVKTRVQIEHLDLTMLAAENLRALPGDPQQAVHALIAAHNALATQVISGEGDSAALLAVIGDFLDKSSALKEAVQGAGKS